MLICDKSSQNWLCNGKNAIIQLHIFGWHFTVNLKYLLTLSKIYMTIHSCWKVVPAVINRTLFLDLYISVVDDKFIHGIYHKVDDFNFEIINYPFPQSNIDSMSGYTTFYSKPIHLFRLRNNINDVLFRKKLSYSKLVKHGYMHSLLFKHRERLCLTYKIDENTATKSWFTLLTYE